MLRGELVRSVEVAGKNGFPLRRGELLAILDASPHWGTAGYSARRDRKRPPSRQRRG